MAIQFKSSKEKDLYREDIRQARQVVLDNAQKKYEKAKWREGQAERRGENTWMLPSLSERIESDELELKKRSKSKKDKKKKHKKEKKKKKHKHKGSISDSDSDETSTWFEKTKDDSEKPHARQPDPSEIGPKFEREEWMSAPLDIIPTITRKDIREKKKREQEEEREKLTLEAGQHARELNPFWKDGGTGLPEEEREQKKSSPGKTAGDGGYGWWKKAYDRCVEQAKEEDRTLEDVAADRYGSLKNIEDKLQQAEISQYGSSSSSRRKSFVRPDDRSDSGHGSRRYMDRKEKGIAGYYRSNDGSKGNKEYDRNSDRLRREYNSSRRRDRDFVSEKKYSSDVLKSGRQEFEDQPKRKFSFLKPGHDSGVPSSRDERPRHRNTGSVPTWKKKSSVGDTSKIDQDVSVAPKQHDSPKHSEIKTSTSVPQSVSSDSESDSTESEGENEADASPVKILTDQEKNQIGAKIVKAEIMGNDALAKQLKSQLEASRNAASNPPRAPKMKKQKHKDDEDGDDDMVVLSRTDRSGMVRPLPDRKHPVEPKGGRRKKQKVDTHTGQGERERYFDDDDKFDLKSLVEREKMGTSEDSNMMFARLAGRTFEKTDDDHQVDDVFMQRASKKQSDSKQEERDRHMAILEHKKMSSALEKCHRCFENVSKHLIVSIGTKVYLCLPDHKSITEGHCFIVPMQHVAQATVVDEDVWDEIQAFRRCLTQMFEQRDEDCVFMETCMGLHRFPHMALECVPMPREVGDMAPIYFKKAIMESESEWSQNKKVVELSQKNIKQAVPKGFPYFAVDFGLQGGFAHVIEDEKSFPWYFGREICGGMMDIEPTLWRKSHKDSFEAQRQKVLQFEEMWKQHDWTLSLKSTI